MYLIHRTESYKPLRDKFLFSSLTARIIYEELSAYLASYLANGPILFLSHLPILLSSIV
jgi:hypothetical protein